MREKLVISKRWHQPQFLYKITNEEMSAEMDMEDFKEALKQETISNLKNDLKQEIGSVTWIIKKETLDKRLDDAIDKIFNKILDEAISRIISGIKEESIEVV